jgi:adenine phosphoribosyltransferase
MDNNELKKYIRDVHDFPKKGIVFKDITTLLKDPVALKTTAKYLFEFVKDKDITKVAAIESRGFIFGSILAENLNAGFIPIRKPGKLPSETLREKYDLEYGSNEIEIHKDSIEPGDKILIHDDLLATGGTAKAATNLIENLGGKVLAFSFIVELTFLHGRDKLKGYEVNSLISYDNE